MRIMNEKMNKVFEFLQSAGTFYLATVEGDQPRVRPYGAMLLFEDKIYIMAFGQTNATKQIAANPKAEICAFKGMTLRIECKLVEDNRPETQKALIEKMPVLKPALGENGETAFAQAASVRVGVIWKMLIDSELRKSTSEILPG